MHESAWVVTGPTSGIGRRTAERLAQHGTVVLVGRDTGKLASVQAEIRGNGGDAVAIRADLSDIADARRAAGEIAALALPIRGVVNNAGIMPLSAGKTAAGLDLTFATDHLGPFAFTEALVPHLADGTNIVFIVSAVEDVDRKIASHAGFRGSRYISAEASARGEWAAGGSTHGGYDAYATAKQGGLAAVFTLAGELPRLRFRAIEPGVNPASNLSRDAGPVAALPAKALSPVLALFPYFSTPKRAAAVITAIVTDTSDATGAYYNERGDLMRASKQVSDPAFSARYIAETRELLSGL